MTAAVVDEAAVGGFDALPAGPGLAAALEEVDPSTLIGEAAAAWLRAAFRARNHQDWLLLCAIRETCSARSGTTVRVPLDEFAPKIAAANLGWTATMAAARLDVALGVLERMPALGESMRIGTMEAAKTAAFVTGLEGLTDEQCRRVVDTVLPDAPSMGLAELRDRILEAAYAVDEIWGAARLAAATARSRVSAETAPSGAVDLCGRDLDPNLAQHAKLRLRALALAIRARLRASGHKRALGFIEARVFIRLMDGTQAGATDDTVIDAVTAELATLSTTGNAGPDPDHRHPDDDDDDDDGGSGSHPDDGDDGDDTDDGRRTPDHEPGPHRGDDNDEPGQDDDRGNEDRGNGDGDGERGQDGDGGIGRDGPRGPRPAPDGGAGPSPATPPSREPIRAGGPAGHHPPPGPPAHDDPVPDDLTPAASCVAFGPGIGVRLALSTLLGLDDQPGLLPGIGPVPADTARAAARARGAGAWKVLIHDEPGHLGHLLTLRAPPDATRDPRFGRQTVQVTAPAALLHALDPTGSADATALDGARPVLLDAATTSWLVRARDTVIRAETADPDEHPATTTRERDRRFPGARLAEFVRARDRTCVAPACTRPAEACDLDHTLDWLHGGRTEATDLEALCRHDHRAKHRGGWTYEQPEPGRFVITDPTGTRHVVQSRVVHPRPAPHTPGHAITPQPDHRMPREDWVPRRTGDGRITPAARATAEHLTRPLPEEPPSRYDHDPDF